MDLWMESNMQKNQYTSNIQSGSTKPEIQYWVELFFGVKVLAMNSHRLWDIQCITDV
uniref:ribosomal protein L23 n=1 Tax=Juncus gracilicaulis TaxID=511724 RepID=UPI001F1447D7|nr:ribosomal protein L23 [Juncus gracilicaulis]YP_010291242.1 ribosomal protein L23 [Juncus gracilicaulis]YP_010291256.1 ribosomal protein L23 [Juncus gracilicaulis]YP_010291257.1 ribosomal protein L23 [Juncus gracilicaulis]ULQ66831.1 ribosomal protein L23 [Juncus gracilicaulis]ULQ66832.1 ribosomal protein L23 [Juncus gracilicaulis]ULQ66846.1 ribosomal protein L23 [Juncus gracilicaulis]ULQ66847.1 ribosomal protein L23 [Juncus gracilicaulis]